MKKEKTKGTPIPKDAEPHMSPAPPPKVAQLERITMDPQALIKEAVAASAPIDTIERLMDLAKDLRAQQAREAWYGAMAMFQRTCPPITKTREARIATKHGPGYRYTYAPLGEIMTTILPVMGPLGLSVSYRTRHEGDRVIASCVISHEFGHSEASGDIGMPITHGDPDKGANPMQRVGIASTYAKRYALLAIIGLAPEDDPDGQGGKAEAGVSRPQRASAKQEPPQDGGEQPQHFWRGQVLKVTAKDGVTNGRKWTRHSIVGDDETTFTTFNKEHAEFAATAGSSIVTIEYDQSKHGNDLISIGPDDDGEE